MNNIFIQKSIVMGIGAMTEDDLDLSDSSNLITKGDYENIIQIRFDRIFVFLIKSQSIC